MQAGYRHVDCARAYDNEKEACLCDPSYILLFIMLLHNSYTIDLCSHAKREMIPSLPFCTYHSFFHPYSCECQFCKGKKKDCMGIM